MIEKRIVALLKEPLVKLYALLMGVLMLLPVIGVIGGGGYLFYDIYQFDKKFNREMDDFKRDMFHSMGEFNERVAKFRGGVKQHLEAMKEDVDKGKAHQADTFKKQLVNMGVLTPQASPSPDKTKAMTQKHVPNAAEIASMIAAIHVSTPAEIHALQQKQDKLEGKGKSEKSKSEKSKPASLSEAVK